MWHDLCRHHCYRILNFIAGNPHNTTPWVMEYPEWFNEDDFIVGKSQPLWASPHDLALFKTLPFDTRMIGEFVEVDKDNKESDRYSEDGLDIATQSPFAIRWLFALLAPQAENIRLEIKVCDSNQIFTFYKTPGTLLDVEKFDRDDLWSSEFVAELNKRGLPKRPAWLCDSASVDS